MKNEKTEAEISDDGNAASTEPLARFLEFTYEPLLILGLVKLFKFKDSIFSSSGQYFHQN